MSAVTVTIGRNVGDRPLPRPEWTTFVANVGDAISDVASDVWVDTSYRGEWNGQAEDAWLWLAQVPDGADLSGLRARLASLAERYRQDAIGLVVGDAALVTATSALDRERALAGRPA